MTTPTWGVVATISAPTQDILNFTAWHLDLGARRVHVYLDRDQPAARAALAAHPLCRVILCDTAYWKRRRRRAGRPDKHQVRQSLNATHCYSRDPGVDWLAHIDADEYLWPGAGLSGQLAALSSRTLSARMRPLEALAPDPDDPPPPGQLWCKGFAPSPGRRRAETSVIYPTYGDHLNGGFLSHVVGKIFVRTGLADVGLRIHKAFLGGMPDPAPAELTACRIVHLHAYSWEHWLRLYRYRLAQGSYREGLKPPPTPDGMALTINQLFATLEAEGGEAALRAFYTEVCTATPDLRARLERHGHLHAVKLDLDGKRAAHFPDHA